MPVEVSYPLIPTGPLSPGGGSSTGSPSPVPFGSIGLLTPFRRGPADFVSASGLALIQSMISQILGTRATTPVAPGELPWRGRFGSKFHLLRHRPNTPLNRELARVFAVEALSLWLPQVRVTDVETTKEKGPQGEPAVMLVIVHYDVVGQRGEIIARGQSASVSLRD